MYNIGEKLKRTFFNNNTCKEYEHFTLAQLPLCVLVLKRDGKIMFINKFCLKTFENLKNLEIGKNILEVFDDITLEYINDCQNSITEFCFEGKWHKVFKVYNKKLVLLYMLNIDENKKIEEKKNNFIASLTHDLKTPTTAQIKALDLLLKNAFGEMNDDQTEIVNEIKKSCQYMSNLIFNITDTYMFDNGQKKLIREKFDWTMLVSETVKEISYLLVDKKQTINIKSELKSSEIYADRFQMKRAITNLISNAITHGSANSEIEIVMSENKDKIYFDVKNKSPYELPKTLDTVFNKFQTSSSAGNGLGLYIVKQIITQEGGSVHALSNKDGKCTFGFESPKKLDLVETGLKIKA